LSTASLGGSELMPAGTDADLPTLEEIARRLSASGDALDALGKSAPGVPAAGDVSGVMGGVIAHLTESAGNMVVGMKAASDEVSKSRQEYASKDEAAAQSLRGYGHAD
jgi:hypothetical protein